MTELERYIEYFRIMGYVSCNLLRADDPQNLSKFDYYYLHDDDGLVVQFSVKDDKIISRIIMDDKVYLKNYSLEEFDIEYMDVIRDKKLEEIL